MPIFATLTATNYAEFIFPPDPSDMGPLLTLADPDYAIARMSASLHTAATQARNRCRSTGLVTMNERPVSDRVQRCSNDRSWVSSATARLTVAWLISAAPGGQRSPKTWSLGRSPLSHFSVSIQPFWESAFGNRFWESGRVERLWLRSARRDSRHWFVCGKAAIALG